MYLIHPIAADGTRQRDHIGADPDRQAEARARLDRFHMRQELAQQANRARAVLDQAVRTLTTLIDMLRSY